MNYHGMRMFRVLLAASLVSITAMATWKGGMPLAQGINDKVNHAFAFLALSFLTDFSYPLRDLRTKSIFLLGYGLAIEIAQAALPYRTFSLFDLGADAFGLALYGMFLPFLRYVPLLKKRWETPSDQLFRV